MKTLLILRHAKSSWSNQGLADHDRPLSSRGKRDAHIMGDLLAAEGLTPDLIISSTAVRARRTAELVAEVCGYEARIVFARDLYLADPDTYVETLVQLAPEVQRVMVVGHNPGVEELIDALTSESVRFTTANIAQVDLPIDHWADLDEDVTGRLVNLWRPKEV